MLRATRRYYNRQQDGTWKRQCYSIRVHNARTKNTISTRFQSYCLNAADIKWTDLWCNKTITTKSWKRECWTNSRERREERTWGVYNSLDVKCGEEWRRARQVLIANLSWRSASRTPAWAGLRSRWCFASWCPYRVPWVAQTRARPTLQHTHRYSRFTGITA